MKKLEIAVFPSGMETISVDETDGYGGAHRYEAIGSLGFENGEAAYSWLDVHVLQFVHKHPDGTLTPGLQSEQLALILLDRHEKLNAKYPSPQYEKMRAGLQMFLDACRERVQERMNRGVMGQLKS